MARWYGSHWLGKPLFRCEIRNQEVNRHINQQMLFTVDSIKQAVKIQIGQKKLLKKKIIGCHLGNTDTAPSVRRRSSELKD